MWDVGCKMWGVGCGISAHWVLHVGCGMWDMCDMGCGVWGVGLGCGLSDVGVSKDVIALYSTAHVNARPPFLRNALPGDSTSRAGNIVVWPICQHSGEHGRPPVQIPDPNTSPSPSSGPLATTKAPTIVGRGLWSFIQFFPTIGTTWPRVMEPS